MIVVGIDVAKDKHDCFIMNSEGEVYFLIPLLFKITEKASTAFMKRFAR